MDRGPDRLRHIETQSIIENKPVRRPSQDKHGCKSQAQDHLFSQLGWADPAFLTIICINPLNYKDSLAGPDRAFYCLIQTQPKSV